MYGASEGLRTLLVERSATGGQAGQSSRIENYLGFPDGVSGGQLTGRARRQATKFGAEILTAREVSGLEVNGAARTIRFSDGSAVAAHSVILATGVSYRQLAAPGCADLTGCGVFYGSALTEAAGCQGHDVYIVGGANSAGQAAMYLSRGAKSVTLLVRGESLTASMSHYLIQQLAEAPNVFVRPGTVVEVAHGTNQLEQLTLKDLASGREELVDAQWLFVFIGAEPHTDWLEGTVLRDERGFIVAGPDMTSDGGPCGGLGAGPPAVPPGDECARCVRRRGRAVAVREAGRVRGGRGSDGRDAGAQVSGAVMTTVRVSS